MMLFLLIGLVLVCHVSANFEITRDELPNWLTAKTVNELHKAYLNLDYNKDGYVSFLELRIGLVSLLDHEIYQRQYEEEQKQGFNDNNNNKDEMSMRDDYLSLDKTQKKFQSWFDHKPESFSCVPSLDAIDFVDCMVVAARFVHNNNIKEYGEEKLHEHHGMTDNSIVLFETALSMYLGHTCTDISPKLETSCQELIETDTFAACHDTSKYCTLSCYQCKYSSKIFGKEIFGNNNNIKEHSVKKVFNKDNLQDHKILLTKSHNVKTPKKLLQSNNKQNSDTMRRLLEETSQTSSKHVFHNLGPKKQTSQLESTSSCKMSKKELHSHSDRFFFISDAHIEPWYDISGSGEISRFTDVECTVANMFECHDSSLVNNDDDTNTDSTSVDCVLNGESDPPLTMLQTAMTAINHRYTRIENSVLFFVGDIQAHSYTDGVSSPLIQTSTSLLYRFLTLTLPFFTSDQLFITPGNNDGEHNSLFVLNENNSDNSGNTVSDVSIAWAQVLIKEGIVNNDLKRIYSIENTMIENWSQTDIFSHIGYYIKQLPEHGDDMKNTYVIVLNTNLGSSNYIQNKLFEYDLNYISQELNGKVIILAHHPNVITSMLSNKYLSDNNKFIIGIFSGHVHYFSETDNNGFTILPSLSQYSYVNAFATCDIDSKTGKLKLDESNLLLYHGYDGETANYACWTDYQD